MRGDPKSEKPKSSAEIAKEKKRLDRELEEGLKGTFPASDPVAITEPGPDHAEDEIVN